jgi:hypothetical protein
LVHIESVNTTLAELLQQTGIDLSALPPVMRSVELAPALGMTSEALAQERYRGGGIPYVKLGRRVRYLRADVARYLVTHRTGGDHAA